MAKRLKKCDVLPKEKQKPSPPNKREKGNVMFCQRKNKNHDHPTKGKRKLASAFNGSYEKGLRNPIIKLIFLFRILTQFSYEEYNDTKHPTTQSNDLVTSPCQL
jgi:hypothetical protein